MDMAWWHRGQGSWLTNPGFLVDPELRFFLQYVEFMCLLSPSLLLKRRWAHYAKMSLCENEWHFNLSINHKHNSVLILKTTSKSFSEPSD